jgi:4-aminobutyrate aminotransferase-like enzyme
MGRTGSQFWAFQKQNVVPDIVTIGKPIGNGHPLGAVITTVELAESFANGMEYFNTYGGNPVSCAIGMAVLDVLEQEHLQEHALQTGTYFAAQLRDLMSSHSIIGDVRGEGLFLGIELVQNRSSLQPAAAEAAYIVNGMKEMGVLLSTDGPLRNVIKIKPPMVFTTGDADLLVEKLDGILAEDAVTHHVS